MVSGIDIHIPEMMELARIYMNQGKWLDAANVFRLIAEECVSKENERRKKIEKANQTKT